MPRGQRRGQEPTGTAGETPRPSLAAARNALAHVFEAAAGVDVVKLLVHVPRPPEEVSEDIGTCAVNKTH